MAAEEDAVKVCVRVRPLIQREQGDQVTLLWKAENSTISQIDGTRSFNFDRVFNSLETTTQVYQEVAVPIIRSALHGYNGTIFAYGQTSSGKTYTMMGTPDSLGVTPQAVREVFRIIQEVPNREFLLRVSYMEIYNETVTDLLCDSRKKKPLEIREDINRNVYVADLTEELVMNPEHVLQWIKKGEKNRHYGETKMNEHSSRSHTIFRMIVESRERNDPGNSENCDGAVMVSHLNLVDLAGSERASQTGAEGVRLKEGCNINRSLFILGQVIKKLSDDQPGVFINYRDSKLTRILQNSLGGNTKTVIICTITPVSFDETLSTLQFASAAKKVKNKPHVNEVLDDEALLKRYRKEIMDLKKNVEDLKASSLSNAMAKEEHSQLLAVIQQLQNEKEERITNLKNIVIDAAVSREMSQEDQQSKRKRRVTWAAEKIQSTLYGSGVSPFDGASKLSSTFPKRAKMSYLDTLPENDESVCTEFSELDDTSIAFEDSCPEWDVGSRVTFREKSVFHHSMIDFHSDAQPHSSALLKDSSSVKCKELEQKLAELEHRLKTLDTDYAVEVERRESLENETLKLQQQLEAKEEEKEKLVKTHQLEIISLKEQLQHNPETSEFQDVLGAHELEALDSSNSLGQVEMNHSHQGTQTVQMQEDVVDEDLSNVVHDHCQEHIKMLEQKISDLENERNYFLESIQICEALTLENETGLNKLTILQHKVDNILVENKSLKQEIATMEKYLQEKKETNEFEMLEKETQKEHETELENKSNVLKEQEKQIAQLKKDAEVLLKRVRYSDLSTSMGGDGDKLCEEVFQLKQSLDDAETVTLDAQRKSAFLRAENLELNEKMDELSLRFQQREKDAVAYEKQLELEKSNYKRMQADLQKELQCAFNEINQLNGLMAGRVPKDLLSRVELEKKIAECSKQLTNTLEEKSALEKEVASLLELKPLPSEIEQLKNQIQKMSEELHLLQSEKEESVCIISNQNERIEEQKEQIERLMEEVTNTQANFQQAEQQYSELKILYEELQTRCSLTDEEIKKKHVEVECLVNQINDLTQSLETLEGKQVSTQQEREELLQAQQELASHTSSIEEMLKSTVSERDELQEQVSNLSSLVESLQQQAERQEELFSEKQDLEQKYIQQTSEMEQLQEQLSNLQSSLSILQTENSDVKLQELQEKMTLLTQQREELHSKVEELTAEKNILKQDLNDNIEMSIETQDELRTTQEQLKNHKTLVTDLRKQISDYTECISVQERYKNITETNEANSEIFVEKKIELEADSQSLISEMEVLKDRIKSSELALVTLNGEKGELLEKMCVLEEDLRSVTEQRDELENTKNNLLVVKDDLKDELERTAKQVCELNEELKRLYEKLSNDNVTGELMEQTQEREKLLETLKAVTDERDQLKLRLQAHNRMSVETQVELENSLDEVKEKSQLLDALTSEVDISTDQTSHLEKDLENKILHLEEQLRTTVNERDQLSEKFRLLAEQMHSLGESQQSALRYELPDKESQDKEVQALPEVLVNEEMTISEQAERSLLKERINNLQQQIHIISQEREQHQQLIDNLKAENLELVSAGKSHTEDKCQESQEQENLVTGLRMQIPGTISVLDKDTSTDSMPFLEEQNLGLQEQLLQKAYEFEQLLKMKNKLEEDQNILNCEVESLTKRMAEAHTNLESLQNEKCQTEEQLLDLQQKLNAAIHDRDDLKIEQESLIAEMEQLKRNLKENDEMVLHLKQEVHERTECQHAELEQSQHTLRNELDETMKDLKSTETQLEALRCEKLDIEEQLLHFQHKMEVVTQELNDLKASQESLTLERDQLKEALEKHDEMPQTAEDQQEQLKVAAPIETPINDLDQLLKNLKDMETQLATLQSGKVNAEEKLFGLQEHIELITKERDELQTTLQRLQSERDQLEEDLRDNIETSIKTQEDLRNTQEELQQQEQRVSELTKQISSIDQKFSLVETELHESATVLKEVTSERDDLEQSKQMLISEVEQLSQQLKDKELALYQVEEEKSEASQKIIELSSVLSNVTEEKDLLNCSKEDVEKQTAEMQNDLSRTKRELDQEKEKVETLTSEISLLKEKLENAKKKVQLEVAAQTEMPINSELDQLLKNLKDVESQLTTVQMEKVKTEGKLLSLQEHMELITKERDELQANLQNLQSERDQLEEDLRDNIEISIKTQEDLRNTQEELQQQRQRVSDLTKEISSLEQKSSSLETELNESATVLKDVTSERDDLDQSKQMLTSEVEQLLQQLKDKELVLYQVEKEKFEASQKIIELSSVLSNVTEEKNLLNCSKEDVEKQTVEMQNYLSRTQEELQHEKERVENLTSQIALLEEKLFSLQRELQENLTLLKAAVEEKEMLDQTKQTLSSNIEQLMESLKSRDTVLELTESENRKAAQKVLELTEEVRTMSQEREQLQLFKENVEAEATKLRENLKQLQHRYDEFLEQETQKSSILEKLQSEVDQLKEEASLKDTSVQQLVTDKADLHRQVQRYELEVASLRQEQEQFQQLLQRARSEKETICTTLQAQEKDTEQLRTWLTICQTELESVKKQKDECKDHLASKINEINSMLEHLTSLQYQVQQLHKDLKDERMKNNDLCEKVDDLEKEIRVLRLMQNEPVQEQDEIAERIEILQHKNQELKALMVNVSTVFTKQQGFVSNLVLQFQTEVQAQVQLMSALKTSLYSTHYGEIGTLQTQYIKVNSQMQNLLNRFKVIYRNAAVKEDQYNLVENYESELCVLQKKNDELLLQCQNLQQNGTKESESAAEELKFCELEFLNHLIFKKMEVMKLVEGGFSEAQVTISSVEGDFVEELKLKKQFLSWLEEFKVSPTDVKKLADGIIQEHNRLSGVIQLLSKKLKVIVRSRIKQDTVAYLKHLDGDLQEKKENNKELLQKMQLFAPSGHSNILEEENARLSERLKHLQLELKKMQHRIGQLENEVTSAKADAKQKGEKALFLQEKLLSSVAETELSEMRAKISVREKHLEAAVKEIKTLQQKVAHGAAPYRDEIDNLKSQMVKFEMDRMKLSKSTDQQIASLKSCIDYKEECLRKLKEQLRRSQKDTDTTVCSEKDGSPSYPLTCGGGSGIVQSTAMLMLQSENAALKREITHYKKKCHQLSRNTSSQEDKFKDRSVETPSSLFSSLTDSTTRSQAVVSPCKSDLPPSHVSPAMTVIHRKQAVSPNKTILPKSQARSPNKTSRHSVPASSPGQAESNRKRTVSPFKTEGKLFSNLAESPRKKQGFLEPKNSPKDKYSERTKSLPYCPSKFFDNSSLGTLPDADLHSRLTTETSEVNWWDQADKNKNTNDCKTS